MASHYRIVPRSPLQPLRLDAWLDLAREDPELTLEEDQRRAFMRVVFDWDGETGEVTFWFDWLGGRIGVAEPPDIVVGKMAYLARMLGGASLVDDEDGELDLEHYLEIYLDFHERQRNGELDGRGETVEEA